MTIKAQNIILIGPMGSGKTTVGKKIARLLKMDFYDVDQELEKITGVSINLIFDIEKEEGFRKREHSMLKQLMTKNNAIIATGGGVVVHEPNHSLLKDAKALIVYLKLEVKHQLQRLKNDKKRPLLQGRGRRERLLDMARKRNPLYEQLATYSFTGGRINSNKMARRIANFLTQKPQ